MDVSERRARIQFLWKRLRLVVRHRGLLNRMIAETQDKERARYGLDPEFN